MTRPLPPMPPHADSDAPADPARRRLPGGIALAGAALDAAPREHAVLAITVDGNGGWWDHVAPPKGERRDRARASPH